ncbi:hypothetical protein BD311DRAFT_763876 [Dichomitus squalens]|uniref:Uncharacterized protein n=1 Tax=Dichomitus squalens TaxID=114155 RepID=A0A4V2JZN8_9APHY|nr:hypothetical protein BD311DRAFT_763876 [Dichomitus squalens]
MLSSHARHAVSAVFALRRSHSRATPSHTPITSVSSLFSPQVGLCRRKWQDQGGKPEGVVPEDVDIAAQRP